MTPHPWKTLKRTAGLAACLLCCASTTALAQGTLETQIADAQAIVEKIKSAKAAARTERSQSADALRAQALSIARNGFYDEVAESDPAKLAKALAAYEGIAADKGDAVDRQVADVFESFVKTVKPGIGQREDQSGVLTALEAYNSDAHWYVEFNARHLSTFLLTHSLNRAEALSMAETALMLIPNDQSLRAQDARIQATELIAFLHNLQNNRQLALENTSRLVDFKIQAGRDVDGAELLNNLLYSAGVWRDHEMRSVWSQALQDIESQSTPSMPGLTQLNIAELKNDIGEFAAAEGLARGARDAASFDQIARSANRQLAISLAGQGKVKAARKVLNDIEEVYTKDDLLTNPHRPSTLYAEALIALHEKDLQFGASLMNRRIDFYVQRILKTNTRDTTSLLATLENSRARQVERNKAYAREAALQRQTITKQRKLNRLLILLAGLLGLGFISAAMFARYRDKISKELAIKTREAESADRMKSEFLGMISHELRTPLNGIIGIADLLASQNKDADVRKKSGIILSSGNQLFGLVESIIDMSRIESGQMEVFTEPMNLKELCEEVIEDWQTKAAMLERPVLYTAHMDPALDRLCDVDPMRLRQCLDVLLSNAVKFTHAGRVHLHLTAAAIGERLTFNAIIADTGAGISEDVQAKLFKPFLQADSSMTRKHNGSGLSLAIARSLARMMDGDVTLVSRQGRGSEFTLTLNLPLSPTTETEAPPALPTAPTPQAEVIDLMLPQDTASRTPLHTRPTHPKPFPAPPVPAVKSETLKGIKVLIVDDIPSNQDIVRLLLEPEGCECFVASDGQDALRVLHAQSIDAVLMDIRMPGMNGIEATRAIRKVPTAFQHVPIIALTADAAASTNAACMAAGADIFLTKPVLAKGLIESLLYLQRHRQHTQGRAKLMLSNLA